MHMVRHSKLLNSQKETIFKNAICLKGFREDFSLSLNDDYKLLNKFKLRKTLDFWKKPAIIV